MSNVKMTNKCKSNSSATYQANFQTLFMLIWSVSTYVHLFTINKIKIEMENSECLLCLFANLCQNDAGNRKWNLQLFG